MPETKGTKRKFDDAKQVGPSKKTKQSGGASQLPDPSPEAQEAARLQAQLEGAESLNQQLAKEAKEAKEVEELEACDLNQSDMNVVMEQEIDALIKELKYTRGRVCSQSEIMGVQGVLLTLQNQKIAELQGLAAHQHALIAMLRGSLNRQMEQSVSLCALINQGGSSVFSASAPASVTRSVGVEVPQFQPKQP